MDTTTWEPFERALAATLAVLKDEFLVLSDRVTGRYLQFHVSPAEGVHAEAVANAWLPEERRLGEGQLRTLAALGWSEPGGAPNHHREFAAPVAFDALAALAVRTLATALEVPDPGRLEYRSFDGPGHRLVLPALGIPAEAAPAPAREPGKPPGGPPPARSRRPATPFARLRTRLLRAARELCGMGSLAWDDAGWLTLPGPRPVFVRAFEDPLFVRVHVQLLHGVDEDEDLLLRVQEANLGLALGRVVVREGTVHLGADFPAAPFEAAHLAQVVAHLGRIADAVERDVRGTLPAPASSLQN